MDRNELMESLFRFAVGELVGLATIEQMYKSTLEISPEQPRIMENVTVPPALQVHQRLAVQCSGGVQFQYEVRWPDGSVKLLNEKELVPYADAVKAAKALDERPRQEWR